MTVVEQKEKKDFSFQENILDLCLECLDKQTVPEPTVRYNEKVKVGLMVILLQYPIDEEAVRKRKHTFNKVSKKK